MKRGKSCQKDRERWQKIIKEAAEQSYRLVIPSIYFSRI
ncbi:16S rRNA (uracil(1498)-N(3))-methyltransferase [Staphylococcus aureus]